MNKVTFEFETEEQKEEFLGWFMDGGGEDEFYSSAVEMRNMTPFITRLAEGDIIHISVCKEE